MDDNTISIIVPFIIYIPDFLCAYFKNSSSFYGLHRFLCLLGVGLLALVKNAIVVRGYSPETCAWLEVTTSNNLEPLI